MNRAANAKVAPSDSNEDVLVVAAGVINTSTLGEEDDTKRSFMGPGIIKSNVDPFDRQLRIKDSKSEETERQLENFEVKSEEEQPLNEEKTIREQYKDPNIGNIRLIAKWENEYKVNVYSSSILAITGTIIWVVEQELYLVYGSTNTVIY